MIKRRALNIHYVSDVALDVGKTHTHTHTKSAHAREFTQISDRGISEMVGWHHPLNGHELEQTVGDNEGQESLARCSP